MTRFFGSAALLAVLASVVASSASAGPTDPPYPMRIDFPAPTVDPVTGVVTTNFAPEGMAVSGDTFYAGSTATGEIIKGNLKTGTYVRNWVPASPNQPSDLHRGTLGLLVDDHNRVWAADSVGMVCGGGGTQPACPAGAPTPQVNYGVIFVYDGNTGAELAQYTVTNAARKLMNDVTIANNAVFISNTTAPTAAPLVSGGPTSDVQFEIPLGAGGALPPGDTPPSGNVGATTLPGGTLPDGTVCPASLATTVCPNYKNPAVVLRPTPNFVSADGIDTLANGNVIFNSFSGTNGQMIQMDSHTGAWSVITVTPEAGRSTGNPAGSLPPLLSGDGVALDGDMLYYPENRLDAPPASGNDTFHCPAPNTTLTCPGDWAVVHLIPPSYTTAEVVTRLNSPPGSGLPPLRSPANMEQLGHYVYGITRVVLPNPVTGALNVTQTFIEHLDKVALTATGSAVSAVEGAAFSGAVATFSDPNNGQPAAAYSAAVDWGDGTASSAGTVGGSGGSFGVSASHTYAEEGTYTVTTTITDTATGASLGTATSTATVSDAALTAGLIKATCGSGPCAVTFSFRDANAGATAADFAASIAWGDGSTTAGVVAAGGGGFVVTGSHAYAAGGSGHAITVTVTDDGGSTASATAPTATAALVAANHGDKHKFTVVATCSRGTATALLNGVSVTNGQVVKLKLIKKGEQKVERKKDGSLAISAASFQLVVSCTDTAGNRGCATGSPVFDKHAANEDENDDD